MFDNVTSNQEYNKLYEDIRLFRMVFPAMNISNEDLIEHVLS